MSNRRFSEGHARAAARGARRAAPPLAIVAVVAAAWLALGEPGEAGRPSPGSAEEPIAVSVHEVRPHNIPFSPRYIGRTEASQTVEIRSRIRGFLNERLFQEGGPVAAGQPLLVIDPKLYESEVAIGRARVAAAEARLERATRQVARYRELFQSKAATSNEVEEWETEFLTATADLDLARAELEKSEINLSYTHIASPIDGVIGRSLRDVGSLVDDGANSLLAIVEQVDPIYIRFTMSERELLRWRALRRAGAVTGPDRERVEVEILQSDGARHAHLGRLSFVDMTVDQTTSTVMLRATAPNPDRTLRSGQPVNVRMIGFERTGVLTVPKAAVLQTPTSASVYVVDRSTGVLEARPVVLGEWHGDEWVIEDGLAAGELVVTDHLLRLRPGAAVVVRDAPPESAEPVASTAEPDGDGNAGR